MGIFRRLRTDDRGAALPAAMAVVLILSLLGAGLIVYAAKGTEGAERLQASQVAQEHAESGIESARAQLEKESNPGFYKSGRDWYDGKKISFPGDDSGSYVEVKIEPTNRRQGSDKEFRVTSSGHHNDTQRRLEAYILAPSTSEPEDPEPDGPQGSRLKAKDDKGNTPYNRAVTIGVLSNDKLPKGERVVASKKTNPRNGSASCSDRKCKYTPRKGFGGKSDAFQYTAISESGIRDSAKVTIRVGEKDNKPPVALDDADTVYAGKRVTFNVLTKGKNDFDPDGPTKDLRVTRHSSPKQGKTKFGSVKCYPKGNCTYTTPGRSGKATFTYEIKDVRGGTDTAKVNIKIKKPPTSSPTGKICATSDQSMGRTAGSGGTYARAMIGKKKSGNRTSSLLHCSNPWSRPGSGVPSSINGYNAKHSGDRARLKRNAKRQGNYYNLRRGGTYNIRLKGSSPVAYITLGETSRPAYAALSTKINIVNYRSKNTVTVLLVNPGGRAVRLG